MNLSQEEINALLGGNSADAPAGEDAPAGQDFSSGALSACDPPVVGGTGFSPDDYQLTAEQIDVLGEVGNMCMGAVATTMYTLLDRSVSITTPRVSVHSTKEVLSVYKIPFVVVQVEYTKGVEGRNLLVLREEDTAMITDLLLGGEGVVEQPVHLDELHLSAISEIMNQMMGASATAMSKLLGTAIDISPPHTQGIDIDNDVSGMLDDPDVVIKVSFDMEIEGLLKSELLQLIPYQMGIELSRRMMQTQLFGQQDAAPPPTPAPTPAPTPTPPPAPTPAPAQTPTPPIPAAAPPLSAPPIPTAPPAAPQPGGLVDVHPVQYPSFDTGESPGTDSQTGMNLIYDIPLNVTVELGRAKREISEILKFGTGTLIVLEKTAGDPVEVIVNGKPIARGEVVVIDDSYGVRITEILGV